MSVHEYDHHKHSVYKAGVNNKVLIRVCGHCKVPFLCLKAIYFLRTSGMKQDDIVFTHTLHLQHGEAEHGPFDPGTNKVPNFITRTMR